MMPSFHNKFVDHIACSALAGNVRRLFLVVFLRSSLLRGFLFHAWLGGNIRILEHLV